SELEFLTIIPKVVLTENLYFAEANRGKVVVEWLPTSDTILLANDSLWSMQFRSLRAGTTTIQIDTAASKWINRKAELVNLIITDGIIESRPASLNVQFQTNNVSCAGAADGSVILLIENANSNYRVVWSTGQIQDNIVANTIVLGNLTAGEYAVTITDNETGSFTNLTGIIITEPTPLQIDTLQQVNISCGDATDGMIQIQAQGGTPPYQYLWSNGDTSEQPTDLAAGNYFLTLSDANGCQQIANFQLTASPLLIANVQTLMASLGENNGRATMMVMGGTPPYIYAWSHDISLIDSLAQNLAAGLYSVSISDANGCEQVLDFEIDQLVNQLNFVENNLLKIYPQPATNYLQIQTNLNIQRLDLLALDGKIQTSLQPGATSNTFFQLPAQLPSGIYLLKIKTGEQTFYQKVVICH
ncbi:MAG: T9SS type A sorting domain-containing protein, partial [Saprospiraceae bacterium]